MPQSVTPTPPDRREHWGPRASGVDDQQVIALAGLKDFFSDSKNFETLWKIADNTEENRRRTGHISLRMLEFICTSHARDNPIEYSLNGSLLPFNVYLSYQERLRQLSKRHFDPFARRNKVVFKRGNKQVRTTSAQMQFFRWAIQNQVIDYCKQNYTELKKLSPKFTGSNKPHDDGRKRRRRDVKMTPKIHFAPDGKKFKLSFSACSI